MVMEAVNIKVQLEDARLQKEAEIEAKRRDFTNTRKKENFADLEQFR